MTTLFNNIIDSSSIKEKDLRILFKITKAEHENILKDKFGDLWISNPAVFHLLRSSSDVEDARSGLFDFLNAREQYLLNEDEKLHPLEKVVIRDSIAVFKNIISTGNEKKTGNSVLQILFDMAKGKKTLEDVSEGFILELVHLFRAVSGLSSCGERVVKNLYSR
jgi:lysine 2,3-aminomutase